MVLTVADRKSMSLLEIPCRFLSDKPLNIMLCYICIALSIYGFAVASDILTDDFLFTLTGIVSIF